MGGKILYKTYAIKLPQDNPTKMKTVLAIAKNQGRLTLITPHKKKAKGRRPT